MIFMAIFRLALLFPRLLYMAEEVLADEYLQQVFTCVADAPFIT